MQEVRFCPTSNIYVLFLRPELFAYQDQSILFNIDDHIIFHLTTSSDSTGRLTFSDNCFRASFPLKDKNFPFIVISESDVFIPSFDFHYNISSSASFNHRSIFVDSSFPFFFKNVSLTSQKDKYVASFLAHRNLPFLKPMDGDYSPDMYLFAVVSDYADITKSQAVTDKYQGNHLVPFPSVPDDNLLDSSVDDDDDDLVSPQSLSTFLYENISLKTPPIIIPSFAESRPRVSTFIYSYQSFVCQAQFLWRLVFTCPRLFMPFLISISQYLYGRNRYPLLTYLLPLFTSLFSIYFLSISGSALFVVYGAIAYLLVARMLKISYMASKIARKIDSDIYPVLFISQIIPLYVLIFSLNLFSAPQLFLLSILFYVYCQFFQYALKFTHFIGDVRMYYKLSPSVVFALFTFLGFDDPSILLPVSFLSVLLLMILFPRVFRLQSS